MASEKEFQNFIQEINETDVNKRIDDVNKRLNDTTTYKIFPDADHTLQPRKDRNKGRLVVGPGARIGGVQPRPGELKKAFYKLTMEAEARLGQARKFAVEKNLTFVIIRQREEQNKIRRDPMSNTNMKQQVITLMSRIYVGSINFDTREEEIKDIFCHYGAIRKIDMSWDTLSMKHKGFAFVEFEVPDAAQLVLAAPNQHLLHNHPVKVGRPSNMPQVTPFIDNVLNDARNFPRIYVANIHPNITEEDVKEIFKSFGLVTNIDMPVDPHTQRHRGYAFIDYKDLKLAEEAMRSMNKFDIGGYLLRVGKAVTVPKSKSKISSIPVATALAAAAVDAKINSVEELVAKETQEVSVEPTIKSEVEPEKRKRKSKPVDDQPNENYDPDDLKVIADMKKDEPPPKPMTPPRESEKIEEIVQTIDKDSLLFEEDVSIKGSNQRFLMTKRLESAMKQRTNVLIIKNMVTPQEVDEYLEEDIRLEFCKHGKVNKVLIKNQKVKFYDDDEYEIVKVFIEYEDDESGLAAKTALNGEHYAGRKIEVGIYDENKYKYNDFSG